MGSRACTAHPTIIAIYAKNVACSQVPIRMENVGATLITRGFGFRFPKGYIYAATAFSGAVEGHNMLARRRRK
jgi:hypothetical protein